MADFENQVSESIRSLYELTTRIDERVKNMGSTMTKSDVAIEKGRQDQNGLLQRVVALESGSGTAVKDLNERLRKLELQMGAVEIISTGNQSKWQLITDAVMKLAVILTATILIWKLGLQ